MVVPISGLQVFMQGVFIDVGNVTFVRASAGGEDAVDLYHETELLPHECHEIRNMTWTVKPTFLHSFLKFKFKSSDYELPCFLHLMTANH